MGMIGDFKIFIIRSLPKYCREYQWLTTLAEHFETVPNVLRQRRGYDVTNLIWKSSWKIMKVQMTLSEKGSINKQMGFFNVWGRDRNLFIDLNYTIFSITPVPIVLLPSVIVKESFCFRSLRIVLADKSWILAREDWPGRSSSFPMSSISPE